MLLRARGNHEQKNREKRRRGGPENKMLESSITDDLEQVSIQIEEVHAVVVAPIDRVGGLDAGVVQPVFRGKEIFAADAERMMTASEWMPDDLRAFGRAERRPRDLEQRKVLTAAIHQYLIAEAGHH